MLGVGQRLASECEPHGSAPRCFRAVSYAVQAFSATHHINQGVKLKPTGRIAKSASMSNTGLFVLLRGLRPTQGSSAPRRILAVLAATFGAFACTIVPVFAATPETPSVVTVESIRAGEATFHGVLDPNATGPSEAGTYEFLYNVGKQCRGGSESSRGLSFGNEHEELPGQVVTGLESHTEYTVCLLARSLAGQEAVGPEEHFTTAIPVEAPEGLKVKEPVGATTATLEGVLNPNNAGEAGSYEFAYRRSATECQRENPENGQRENENATPNEPSGGGQGEAAKPAEITELLPHVQYTFCLVAHNNAGETTVSSPVTFTTGTKAPNVIATTLSHPGSAGVTVGGQIEPGGLETAYSVQYGTSSAYGFQTTPVSISPSTSSATVAVTVPLSNLDANTAYHLRLVVTNTAGEAGGGDVAFTTYPAGVAGLPDGRVYEMVTPPENHNAEVYELGEGLLGTTRPYQAAANGNSVAYVAEPATGGNGSTGAGEAGDEYLASRSPQGGWSQVNVTPAGSTINTEYQGFSSDLSVGFLLTAVDAPFVTTPSLVESAGSPLSMYSGLYSHAFGESLYRPLFTGTPPYRPASGKEGKGAFGASFSRAPVYAGSSVDVGVWLFEANDALLAGEGPPELESELDENVKQEAKEMKEVGKLYEEAGNLGGSEEESKKEEARQLTLVAERDELYESVDGHLSLVNVLPDGKLAPGATFGGQRVDPALYAQPDFSHDISTDGSRIFWTALEPIVAPDTEYTDNGTLEEELRPGKVYVREDGTSTVAVSQGPAQFWTASSDGKYAFYTEAGKLWRFDVEDQTRTELTGAGSDVGGVIGTNETGEDGAYVYFVAGGMLASNANGDGEVATARACERSRPVTPAQTVNPGEPLYEELHGRLPVDYGCNLYVSHGGETRFIATLTVAGEGNDWAPVLGGRTSNITPDGRGLVFSARENLTGASYPGEGSEEVYVYGAGDGSLFCASCRPQASGGHLPTGFSLVYTYRRISEDGDQVFFDSEAPLVARDVSGTQQVYEWERDGSGACNESDGCIYLLSNGVEGSAFLIDASVSGNDVFFEARQKLVPEADEDANLYDARVGGVPPVGPPECSGTACQGVPAPPPTFATPASVTFNGVGNFPPLIPPAEVKLKRKSKSSKCKKGYAKKKGKCVRKKRSSKSVAKKSAKGRK
jgi:hypothetical protein